MWTVWVKRRPWVEVVVIWFGGKEGPKVVAVVDLELFE